MASPVICVRDASIPNNTFQIVDLFPNRSQTNPLIDPASQGPRYLRQPVNTTPVVDGLTIAKEVSGLVAYLLVNQENALAPLSVTDATTISDLYISRMRDGLDLSTATMNGLIGVLPGLAGVVVEGVNSTTLTSEILSILSGAKYTVPAGHTFIAGGALVVPTVSFFDTTVFNAIDENDSSFYLSLNRGALSKAKSVRVDPRTGATLDPLVVVYSGTGAVL